MRRLSTFFILALATVACADHNRTIAATKIGAPPTIDGTIKPEEWASAARSTNFVHIATGSKTEFDATIYIAYDDKNIYFAVDCPDGQPNLIRSSEKRRDADLDGDDHIVILLNPFNTHQNNDQNEFILSAGGGIKAQFAGGRSAKREWEGAWDGKSTIDSRGWQCEMVIPWKVLRLPGAGKRDIEVNFARVIPRTQTAIAWCDIGPQEQMQNNGSWTGVDVPKINDRPEILALPFQIVGYNQETREEVVNTGIDLRYNVTPQISSLMTINPDFRNVEGSILNLTFSRFERLAEERRPFFVEGQSEFRMGGMSASLFAPQRLGSFDMGLKAFGKLNDNQSFGTMFTTRFDHQSAAVARYRQTWGDKSYMSTGVVHWNDPDNGIQNTATAIELVEWKGKWGGDVIYNSTDDSIEGTGKRFDADLLYQDANTFAAVGYQEISENFLPRIGFAPRKGFKGYYGSVFNNREFSGGPLSKHEWRLNYVDNADEDGDGVYLRSLDFGTELVTRSRFEFGAEYERSNFRGELAEIGALYAAFPENDPYRNIGVHVAYGKVDGEDYRGYSIRGNYRFFDRLSVSPSVQWEEVGEDRQQLFILGASYEIDKNRSIAGRAVVREGKTNWYLAYRLSGNIGAEWYVILGDPNAETFQKKLIVKAVFPFTLKL